MQQQLQILQCLTGIPPLLPSLPGKLGALQAEAAVTSSSRKRLCDSGEAQRGFTCQPELLKESLSPLPLAPPGANAKKLDAKKQFT